MAPSPHRKQKDWERLLQQATVPTGCRGLETLEDSYPDSVSPSLLLAPPAPLQEEWQTMGQQRAAFWRDKYRALPSRKRDAAATSMMILSSSPWPMSVCPTGGSGCKEAISSMPIIVVIIIVVIVKSSSRPPRWWRRRRRKGGGGGGGSEEGWWTSHRLHSGAGGPSRGAGRYQY